MIRVQRHDAVTFIRMYRSFFGQPVFWGGAYLVDGLMIDCGPAATARELAHALQGERIAIVLAYGLAGCCPQRERPFLARPSPRAACPLTNGAKRSRRDPPRFYRHRHEWRDCDGRPGCERTHCGSATALQGVRDMGWREPVVSGLRLGVGGEPARRRPSAVGRCLLVARVDGKVAGACRSSVACGGCEMKPVFVRDSFGELVAVVLWWRASSMGPEGRLPARPVGHAASRCQAQHLYMRLGFHGAALSPQPSARVKPPATQPGMSRRVHKGQAGIGRHWCTQPRCRLPELLELTGIEPVTS